MKKLTFLLKLLITNLLVDYVLGSDVLETNSLEHSDNNLRKKRLLFYDEDGNLVKTYTNPFLKDFVPKIENYPFFGDFYKQFQGFLHPTTFTRPMVYMVPVSDQVIEQIVRDPIYQNKFMVPVNEGTILPSPICDGKRTQIPSPNSCGNFLNCWDGWAVEQQCPAGLLFSDQGFCDYPHQVDCKNRRRYNFNDESNGLKCEKEFETLRNEVRCGEFFVCVNRIPIKFKCPADLYFNQALGVCDYSYKVKCNVNYSITPPESPATEMTSGITENVEMKPSPADKQSPNSKSVFKMFLDNEHASSDSTSENIAMSKQEAIDRLQIGRIANINISQ